MSEQPIHVVGGGIGGLVAAITAAEVGAPVVLHEASDRLGGRALGTTRRRGVNLGPRVLFTDGALLRWLQQRSIPIPLRWTTVRGVRILDDAGLHFPLVESVRLARALPPRQAPVDTSFADWATSTFGEDRADLMARLAGLATYHHDPGALSARFVWERWRRAFLRPQRVRWIAGGWSSLIDALAARAEDLGVVISVGERMTAHDLPSAPTIIATQLTTAARLLQRPLEWPGTRTALLDVILPRDSRFPSVVADVRSDLTTCCMVERGTAFDPDLLSDRGADLFQAQLGVPPGTSTPAAVERIERTLDEAVPRWREGVTWREARVVVDATGAVDLPGLTWRDRPAIDQGDDMYLVGDAVAAPGVLSEVSANSAVHAARLALEARRRRAFAVGWPSVELTAQRRLAILAAALPGARHRAVITSAGDTSFAAEPVDETGPGYRLVRRLGFVVGTSGAHGATATPTTTVVPPTWLPLGTAVSKLVATTVSWRRVRSGG